jgi:hypothetical protein
MVKEKSPENLDRLKVIRRTSETIDLNELTWYDFTEFDQALEIYRNRKQKVI